MFTTTTKTDTQRRFPIESVVAFLLVLTCGATLFLRSAAFVSAEVAPKWYGFVFGMSALAAVLLLAKRMDWKAFAAAGCTGVVALLAMQAAYGILQYAGLLAGANGFRTTGSFDNPAGFAASLAAGLPFACCEFLLHKRRAPKILFAAAALLTLVAIGLAQSRAGAISAVTVLLCVVFYQLFLRTSIKVALVVIGLALALFGLYWLKKDSADGRLLIWQCTLEMVKAKPLLGFGHGGFAASYMNFQADYLAQHPDSPYAMLADNVHHPFNEYLLLLASYGVAGVLLLLSAIVCLVKAYRRGGVPSLPKRAAAWCLLSVGVFALFSYPLTYPFVWVAMAASVAIMLGAPKHRLRSKPLKAAGIATLALLCAGTFAYMRAEMQWCRIAHLALRGETLEVLPEYQQLYPMLRRSRTFLYNYAAELNIAEQYEHSLRIARECDRLWADYDLQRLMADNFQNMQQPDSAIAHLQRAANMCPNRFTPLCDMAKIYAATGRREAALRLAREVVSKPVKIPSPEVFEMKKEMETLIHNYKLLHHETASSTCRSHA